MKTFPTIIPSGSDRPAAYLGGHDENVPAIALDAPAPIQSATIQFRSDADAIAYCRQLARAAEWLADRLEGHHAEEVMA